MPPDPDAPDCKRCGWHPADEDGFCSDSCYQSYSEVIRKEFPGDSLE